MVARAASQLVHHGSPYLPSGQLLSAQSYNPYLPAMSVFGFPHLAGLPGLLGNPASWMAVTTLALIAAALGASLPHRPRYRAFDTGSLLLNTSLAVVTPVLALPIALGTTDPPVIALMCLALACASRSRNAAQRRGGRPAQGQGPGVRHRAGSLERAGGPCHRYRLRGEGHHGRPSPSSPP